MSFSTLAFRQVINNGENGGFTLKTDRCALYFNVNDPTIQRDKFFFDHRRDDLHAVRLFESQEDDRMVIRMHDIEDGFSQKLQRRVGAELPDGRRIDIQECSIAVYNAGDRGPVDQHAIALFTVVQFSFAVLQRNQ